MRSLKVVMVMLLAGASVCLGTACNQESIVATFSIVGFDPETEELGIAVASKFLAVGAVVPWAKAGVGAVATQSYANTTYGPEGLRLMASGLGAPDALDNLVSADSDKERRQVGIMDAKGTSATFTGKECITWAGGKAGKYYACQGNILIGEETVNAMAETFNQTEGALAVRLVKALKAGEDAGGDSRGKQSAALLVVKEAGGYLGLNDRHINLHVEDHVTPILELKRLLNIRHAQLAAVETASYLDRVDGAKEAERKTLIKKARGAAERGIRLYKGDDHLWWLTARARWMDDDRAGAEEAGRAALLVSPSWPRLPEKTRAELGLPQPLVAALRQSDGFRALWDSLATKETVE